MQVEWTVDGGSVEINPAGCKGMSPAQIRDAILDLCHFRARVASVSVPGLDAAVAAVVEALRGKLP